MASQIANGILSPYSQKRVENAGGINQGRNRVKEVTLSINNPWRNIPSQWTWVRCYWSWQNLPCAILVMRLSAESRQESSSYLPSNLSSQTSVWTEILQWQVFFHSLQKCVNLEVSNLSQHESKTQSGLFQQLVKRSTLLNLGYPWPPIPTKPSENLRKERLRRLELSSVKIIQIWRTLLDQISKRLKIGAHKKHIVSEEMLPCCGSL